MRRRFPPQITVAGDSVFRAAARHLSVRVDAPFAVPPIDGHARGAVQ